MSHGMSHGCHTVCHTVCHDLSSSFIQLRGFHPELAKGARYHGLDQHGGDHRHARLGQWRFLGIEMLVKLRKAGG